MSDARPPIGFAPPLRLVALCEADHCCAEATARARFTWADRTDMRSGASTGERNLKLCAPCAVGAANIAAAMGMTLELRPLAREGQA